jgi:hypothetical protein
MLRGVGGNLHFSAPSVNRLQVGTKWAQFTETLAIFYKRNTKLHICNVYKFSNICNKFAWTSSLVD